MASRTSAPPWQICALVAPSTGGDDDDDEQAASASSNTVEGGGTVRTNRVRITIPILQPGDGRQRRSGTVVCPRSR
jgi:hypothetical protein